MNKSGENTSPTQSPFLRYTAVGALIGGVVASVTKILFPENFSQFSFLEQSEFGLLVGALLGVSAAGWHDSYKIGRKSGK